MCGLWTKIEKKFIIRMKWNLLCALRAKWQEAYG
uniref:Uncharacterized protein n=1 Tax=Podoviridae sp. ctuQh21 TaxID=2825284 RepID=A0A8S5PG39_9CAUD|nr:MAG TPA: hypothetical protein [Podoviridae sp. ctuQh21]DAR63649.1 MAG TPA: hypothetical protein [Caudoviricetes sp.]DAT30020.1 MAG TPA: hypothetical protein [Caudoviricetes sp.]